MLPPHGLAGIERKLGPADASAFAAHLLRLDAEGRRSRFAMVATDAFVTEYARTSFALDGTVIGYFENGMLRAVAEIRPIGAQSTTIMEAAFSVEPAWRRRGVATALFRTILDLARNRGVTHLYTSCLRSNGAMQSLARKFEAELVFEEGDVMAIVPAPRRNAFSIWREWMGDAAGVRATLLQPIHDRTTRR